MSNEILERSSTMLFQIDREEVGLNIQTTSPAIGAVVVRGLTGKMSLILLTAFVIQIRHSAAG